MNLLSIYRLGLLSLACLAGLQGVLIAMSKPNRHSAMPASDTTTPSHLEKATFGAGCFWCVEAVFQRYEGVHSATSGYMGGTTPDPSYEQVVTGRTGHAEVVQVAFDPKTIRYEDLLAIFWAMHDPTTLNRQGADVGTQYRSAIFYHSEEQKSAAEESKRNADSSGEFDSPIVTEITEAPAFYPAEDYHQDFFNNNPDAPYCRYVILPKLEKLNLK